MRKSFLLILSSLFIVHSSLSIAYAQDFGIRYGIGIGGLRNHMALQSLAFGPNAIRLYPSISVSAGLAFDFEVNSIFSIAPELQYTLYKAYGFLTLETGMDLDELHEAGAVLHSLELPILARFNFGSFYAEAGPQFGANIHAKIYTNREQKRPDINTFAFGPSAGFGVNRNGLLLGFRGHFGLLEYAKKMNGYPWAVQASAGCFIF